MKKKKEIFQLVFAALSLMALLVFQVADLHVSTHNQDNPVEQCELCLLAQQQEHDQDYFLASDIQIELILPEFRFRESILITEQVNSQQVIFGAHRNRPPPHA